MIESSLVTVETLPMFDKETLEGFDIFGIGFDFSHPPSAEQGAMRYRFEFWHDTS